MSLLEYTLYCQENLGFLEFIHESNSLYLEAFWIRPQVMKTEARFQSRSRAELTCSEIFVRKRLTCPSTIRNRMRHNINVPTMTFTSGPTPFTRVQLVFITSDPLLAFSWSGDVLVLNEHSVTWHSNVTHATDNMTEIRNSRILSFKDIYVNMQTENTAYKYQLLLLLLLFVAPYLYSCFDRNYNTILFNWWSKVVFCMYPSMHFWKHNTV